MSDPARVTTTQRIAWILTIAGLAPFFGHALFAWVTPLDEAAGVVRSLAQYAAVILAFVGALHWGATLASPDLVDARAARRLGWSVAPALVAWLTPLYAPRTALAVLLAAMLVAWGVDLLLYRGTAVPRWFLVLRTVATALAVLALAATWWAVRARAIG